MIPLIREQKQSTPLIEITFGTVAVYATLSKSPVTWGGNLYLPEPAIDVKLPKQSGMLTEETCQVILPRNSLHAGVAAVAEAFATPRACAPMRVRVLDLIQSANNEVMVVYLYDGIAERSTRNPGGSPQKVQLDVVPEWRLQLADVSLGRRADSTCDHTWGSLGCEVDITRPWGIADAGNPTAVRTIHVTCAPNPNAASRQVDLLVDPTFHPGITQNAIIVRPQNWWKRGFLEKDGLRISIADWKWNTVSNNGTNTFVLNRIPPKSWVNAPMLLYPGCPRTPEACMQRRGDTMNFGGLGFGIPAYNPTIDRSGS